MEAYLSSYRDFVELIIKLSKSLFSWKPIYQRQRQQHCILLTVSKSLFSWKPIYQRVVNLSTEVKASKSLFSWKPIYHFSGYRRVQCAVRLNPYFLGSLSIESGYYTFKPSMDLSKSLFSWKPIYLLLGLPHSVEYQSLNPYFLGSLSI